VHVLLAASSMAGTGVELAGVRLGDDRKSLTQIIFTDQAPRVVLVCQGPQGSSTLRQTPDQQRDLSSWRGRPGRPAKGDPFFRALVKQARLVTGHGRYRRA
jgi:hypothetical protein